MLRLRFRLIIFAMTPVLLLLAISWLGDIAPGAFIVAIPLGLVILLLGVRFFSRVADTPPHISVEPEDVGDLDVYFVCVECRTEFRVEKLGELQVPRHCGERMLVERRPRIAPDLT